MMTREERRQLLEARRRKGSHTKRLWIPDEFRLFPVWDVPTECLLLTVDNRRFRAERRWAEELLGRPLDPENIPDDLDSIESLLLDTQHRASPDGTRIVGKDSDDTEHLKRDWKARTQEEPLWILPDGTVRNGNRRLAMLRRMAREEGDTGHTRVQVVILDPEEIDEPTLLQMEQREQLTENFKVRYNDIDYLLALKEAADDKGVDWGDRESMEAVAGQLQAMVEKSQGEVFRDLTAIRWMDYFLEESGQPGQYHKLMRQLERFRDVGRTMVKVEEDYSALAPDVIQVLFSAIRAGHPHQDIRRLRNMFLDDRERFLGLRGAIEVAEKDWDPRSSGIDTPSRDTGDATPSRSNDEDEPEAEGPAVPHYPKADVTQAIKVAIDAFDTRGEDILVLLQEALQRLRQVADDKTFEASMRGGDDRALGLRDTVKAVAEWVGQYAQSERD